MKEEKTEEDLIEYLLGTEISFIVVVHHSRMMLEKTDYFVAINKSDIVNVEKPYLDKFEPAYELKTVLHADMSEKDIEYFKANQNLFTKVQHNSEGRVYEVKGRSMNDKYKEKNKTV